MNGEDREEAWITLTGYEQQCAESIEIQPDPDLCLNTELENSNSRLWGCFQESATAIAQLYRERDPSNLWGQFQLAATTTTLLYKGGLESMKKGCEVAKQSGYQKRNREILNWAKKNRRLIRRDELLAYLSGKPLPPRQPHHSHHRLSPRPRNLSPPPGVILPAPDLDLHTFRDALREPISRSRATDLCNFIAGEISRNLKRSASPSDVIMGSPSTHKKPRYL